MFAPRHRPICRAAALAALVAATLGVPTVGGFSPLRAQAHRVRQACAAALGAYVVGVGPFPRSGAGIIPYPAYGDLSGTITLAGAAACGSKTAGSFDVHLSYPRLPAPQAQRGSSSALPAIPAPVAATTVLTATGTFGPDAAHPNDPGYIAVSGTVTYGRYTSICSGICPAQPSKGPAIVCRPGNCGAARPTVTSVVSFTAVTGYLRLQGGAPRTVVLAFLPPPDSSGSVQGAAAFDPLVLTGRRTV